MSLTKFVMQPTLHLLRLCGFKKHSFQWWLFIIDTYEQVVPDI
jgi:hypothetical protein